MNFDQKRTADTNSGTSPQPIEELKNGLQGKRELIRNIQQEANANIVLLEIGFRHSRSARLHTV